MRLLLALLLALFAVPVTAATEHGDEFAVDVRAQREIGERTPVNIVAASAHVRQCDGNVE